MTVPISSAAGLLPASASPHIYGVTAFDANEGTDFLSPKVRHLYGWWRSAAGGRPPLRDQFDILDHRPIVSNVFLVTCEPDGGFVYRLLGEEAIAIVGRNTKGLHVDRHSVGAYGHALYAYYADIVARKLPRRCVGSLVFADRGWARFESIDCPLSRDGRTVSEIIGVIDQLPAG